MTEQPMNIELTPRAAEEIRQVMTLEAMDPAHAAVRVDVETGRPGQPGGGYVLDLVRQWSEADDAIGESQNIRIVCRRERLWRVEGTVIDFRDETAGRGFVFDRPAIQREAAAVQHEAPPDEHEVRAALTQVIDPEVGLNIVDLGLVYGIRVEDWRVHLTITMTTPACPLSEHIKQDATRRVLSQCAGAAAVDIELVWDPPWGPHMMSKDAKKQMGWASK